MKNNFFVKNFAASLVDVIGASIVFSIVGIMMLSVSGCSRVTNFLDPKVSVDYEKNASVKALEIPPDLTSPQFDDAFALPTSGTVSAAAMQNGYAYTPTASNTASANNNAQPVTPRIGRLSSVRSLADETVLQIHDTYQRAFILTDIILQRMGFTTLRKDPAKGLYRVEYEGADIDADGNEIAKKGFFSRLFNRSSNNLLTKGNIYQFEVKEESGVPLVRVKDAQGKPLKPQTQVKIIKLMDSKFNQ